MELYVDLHSNSLKTMLLHETTIYEMKSMPYTNDVFDRLYTMLKVYGVRKVCFITHTMYARCVYKNSCVTLHTGNLVGLISNNDLQLLTKLCDAAGVSQISFVDKAGMYVRDGNKNACYVDHYNGMVYMYCVGEGITDFASCTEVAFDDKLQEFMRRNGLTEEVTFSGSIDSCMQFMNAAMVLDDERAIQDLCTFAYAALENEFVYSPDVLTADGYLLKSVEQPKLSEPPKQLRPSKTPKRSKIPKPLKQPSVKRAVAKKRASNILSYLILLAGLAGIIISLFFIWKRIKLEDDLRLEESVKAELENSVNSQQSLLQSYQAYLDKPYDTPAVEYVGLQKIIDEYNGELRVFSYDGENTVASATVTSVTDELLQELSDAGYSTEMYDTDGMCEIELHSID